MCFLRDVLLGKSNQGRLSRVGYVGRMGGGNCVQSFGR